LLATNVVGTGQGRSGQMAVAKMPNLRCESDLENFGHRSEQERLKLIHGLERSLFCFCDIRWQRKFWWVEASKDGDGNLFEMENSSTIRVFWSIMLESSVILLDAMLSISGGVCDEPCLVAPLGNLL
jgi:hypothetical protein